MKCSSAKSIIEFSLGSFLIGCGNLFILKSKANIPTFGYFLSYSISHLKPNMIIHIAEKKISAIRTELCKPPIWFLYNINIIRGSTRH